VIDKIFSYLCQTRCCAYELFKSAPFPFGFFTVREILFGYVSIYDIQDAVDDGATVPIYYESRLAKLDLNHDEISALSDEVDEGLA
jgi:type I restriction enzyme R subunit